MSSEVLCVEDDVICQVLVKRVLEQALDCQVFAVGNAYEALDWVAVRPPDLVIVDLGLPGLNGFALHRLLPLRLPCVALTALTDIDTQQRCEQAGFQAVLFKPFTIVVIVATVRELLSFSGA